MDAAMQDRVIGVPQGLAIGDVMGAPMEGMALGVPYYENRMLMSALANPNTDPSIRNWAVAAATILSYVQRTGGLVTDYLGILNTSYFDLLESTDDGTKAAATMRCIIDMGEVDRYALGAYLVKWYQGGYTKGVGGTTCLMLAELDPREGAIELDPRVTSQIVRMRGKTWYLGWGQRKWNEQRGAHSRRWQFSPAPANGAEMSIAVVALALLGDDVTQDQINAASDAVVCITHPYPQCYQTCRAVVTLTRDLVRTGDLVGSLERTAARYPNLWDAARQSLQAPYPHTGGNLETFTIAIDALANTTSYESAVIQAINASTVYGDWATDSDTYAALTGGLAGAAYGASGIPQRWARPVDLSGNLIRLKPASLEELAELALAMTDI